MFFHRAGVSLQNICANELIQERGGILKNNLPHFPSNIYVCDAMELNFKDNFDVVFQSTVFTSILDNQFKSDLATKMFDMTKPGGLILWYDFKYNNPMNKDVKGVNKKEIKALFPEAKKIIFYNVTLAPPIGRMFGRLYNLINNLFPFLRTHIIAEIYK